MLCLTEHFLSHDKTERCHLKGFTTRSAFCRQNAVHGGSLIMVRNDLTGIEQLHIKELSVEREIEVAAVKIIEHNIMVISIYRPPHGNFNVFMGRISEMIDTLGADETVETILLMGDFNVNFAESGHNSNMIVDIFNSLGLNKMFDEYSRVTASSSTCIDNIFSNVNMKNCVTKTVNLHLSDHMGQILKFPTNTESNVMKEKILCRQFSDKNIMLFTQMIRDITSLTSQKESAKNVYDGFHNFLISAFEQSFPLKQIRKSNNKYERIPHSEELVSMRNRLDALAVVAKTSRNDVCYHLYNDYKRIYTKRIQTIKRQQNTKIIENSSNVTAATWKLINSQLSSNNRNSITDSSLTADSLNGYFCGVGEETALRITSAVSPLDVLREVPVSGTTSFFLRPVSCREIDDIISRLKNKPSRDIYGMNASIIKAAKNDLSQPLERLINVCIKEGYFPDQLKIGRVVPVHKKGDMNDCRNYRPISVLPIISKIFEQVIANRLAEYLENKNYLVREQHGYRKNKSTMTAMVGVLKYINEALDEKKMVRMSLLDLSKAFDTVDHSILLQKLEYYGVRGIPLILIQSYLTQRMQVVELDGKRSEIKTIKYGVPQGSILGPLLFIIYLNDMISYLDQFQLCCYADDTTILVKDDNEMGLTEQTRTALGNAEDWFAANKLKLNENKTQQLTLSSRPEGNAVVKFLGVYMDDGLKWCQHVDHLAKKLASGIYCIKRMKIIATEQAAILTYHSFIHCHLSYGILFWATSSAADRIFLLQKRAIRTLCGLQYRDSCRGYFKQHNILTLMSLYIYNALKYIHGNRDKYKKNGDDHDHDTRRRADLYIPRHRTVMTQRNVHYWGVKLYNRLPQQFKELNMRRFATETRSMLVRRECYTIDEYLCDDT